MASASWICTGETARKDDVSLSIAAPDWPAARRQSRPRRRSGRSRQPRRHLERGRSDRRTRAVALKSARGPCDLQDDYSTYQAVRAGLNHLSLAPYGAYHCADGKDATLVSPKKPHGMITSMPAAVSNRSSPIASCSGSPQAALASRANLS